MWRKLFEKLFMFLNSHQTLFRIRDGFDYVRDPQIVLFACWAIVSTNCRSVLLLKCARLENVFEIFVFVTKDW